MKCAGLAEKACLGIGTPRVEDLERAVLAEVLRQAAELRDETPDALARRSRAARAGVDAETLRVEERGLLDSLARAGALLAQGTFDALAYDLAAKELRAQLKTVQDRLEVAERQAGAAVTMQAMASIAERLEHTWPEMTTVERRAFVGLFLRAARVQPPAYRGDPVSDRLTFEEA